GIAINVRPVGVRLDAKNPRSDLIVHSDLTAEEQPFGWSPSRENTAGFGTEHAGRGVPVGLTPTPAALPTAVATGPTPGWRPRRRKHRNRGSRRRPRRQALAELIVEPNLDELNLLVGGDARTAAKLIDHRNGVRPEIDEIVFGKRRQHRVERKFDPRTHRP